MQTLLSDMLRRDPRLVTSQGVELKENSEVLIGETIRCITTSYPKSDVELSGDNLADISDPSCDIDGHDLWRCSVTATFKGDGRVLCKLTYMGLTFCVVDDEDCNGIFLETQGENACERVFCILNAYVWNEASPNHIMAN